MCVMMIDDNSKFIHSVNSDAMIICQDIFGDLEEEWFDGTNGIHWTLTYSIISADIQCLSRLVSFRTLLEIRSDLFFVYFSSLRIESPKCEGKIWTTDVQTS